MKYLILILLSLCSYSVDLSGQIIMPTPGKIERADGRLRLQGKIRMYAEESPGSFIRLFYEKLVLEKRCGMVQRGGKQPHLLEKRCYFAGRRLSHPCDA